GGDGPAPRVSWGSGPPIIGGARALSGGGCVPQEGEAPLGLLIDYPGKLLSARRGDGVLCLAPGRREEPMTAGSDRADQNEVELGQVQETLFIPLVGRAEESKKRRPL